MIEARDIAVVVTCYDLGRTIEEAIDSVVAQTRPASEIILVDDGSTDIATRQVLSRLRRPKLRVVVQPHAGVAVARNRGVAETTAPYVLFLDGDDVLAPDYLETTAARLDADAALSFVSCAVRAFEGASYVWKPPALTPIGTLTRGSVHTSTLFRRSLWDAVGGFDPELPAYEDLDFWLRAVVLGFRGEILDEPLLHYRVRADSRYRSAVEPATYRAAMARILSKHGKLLASGGLEILREKERFLAEILDYQDRLREQHRAGVAELAALRARIGTQPVVAAAVPTAESWRQFVSDRRWLARECAIVLDGDLDAAWRAVPPGGALLAGAHIPAAQLRERLAAMVPLDSFEVEDRPGLACASVVKPPGRHPRMRFQPPTGPRVRGSGGMILAYHRVAALHPDPFKLCTQPALFRDHMRYLRERCTPMPLDELYWASRAGALPPRAVAVTLDDGYLDALTTAAPILAECGIPATCFVNSERLAEPHEAWHDLLERRFGSDDAGRQAMHARLFQASLAERARLLGEGMAAEPRPERRLLTDREIVELSQRPGITVGSHSQHHLFLPEQPPDVQRSELADCKRALETLIDRPVVGFCYPFGGTSPQVAQAARETPHLYAVTTEPGVVTAATDPMLLPRFEVTMGLMPEFVTMIEHTFALV